MAITTYRETIDWLYGLQVFGIKLGLANIQRLLELLDNPHTKLRCIHIAGTNGKGSTAAFLHSIYCRAGYRPGLYTSPHLVDFTERIVVGGRPIQRGYVCELVSRIQRMCRRNDLEHITFFEFTTALAFVYFAQEKADPVILETGLGGRLDATNVVDPLLSIITSIGREHTMHLGSTLKHIAREKAGIIKPGRPCVSALTRSGPRECIRRACMQNGSALFEYGHDFTIRRHNGAYDYVGPASRYDGLRPGLVGRHQAKNAALAITAAELLRSGLFSLSDMDIAEGVNCCVWPGRLETIRHAGCRIVLDGAHNAAAWQVLAHALQHDFDYRRLILIIGIMRDKDIASLQRLAARAHLCIYFKPRMKRAAGRREIEKYTVFSEKKRVLWCETIAQSLATAIAETGHGDLICITGSLFAVGEARELLSGRTTVQGRRIGL